MKYSKKIVLFNLTVALILMMILSHNVLADKLPQERLLPLLIDDADLLINEEEHILNNRLDSISENYYTDVVIVTNYSLDGKTATEYADDFFDYNGYGFHSTRDGILFLLSMEYSDWAFSTHGSGIQTFTDAGQAFIMDQFLEDLGNENYSKAFNYFIDLCEAFLEQASKGEPYDRHNLHYFSLNNISDNKDEKIIENTTKDTL